MQSKDLATDLTLHGGIPMGLCHSDPVLQSAALQRLGQFILARRQSWAGGPPDFERFEHELHEQVQAIECELLAEELARYDVTAD